MENIKVRNGEQITKMKKEDYIIAKTKDLREFGYTSLSESEVEAQLDLILTGKGILTNVIGSFMKVDIVI